MELLVTKLTGVKQLIDLNAFQVSRECSLFSADARESAELGMDDTGANFIGGPKNCSKKS